MLSARSNQSSKKMTKTAMSRKRVIFADSFEQGDRLDSSSESPQKSKKKNTQRKKKFLDTSNDKYIGESVFNAVNENDSAAVLVLVQAGSPVDAKKQNGDTALMVAIRLKRVECIKLLLALGADITIKNLADESAYILMKEVYFNYCDSDSQLSEYNAKMFELALRIINAMKTKEHLLEMKWDNFKRVISAFVKGKLQVKPNEWDHIQSLFPGKKEDFLEWADELDTTKARKIKKDIIKFNPFNLPQQQKETARFFAPAPVAPMPASVAAPAVVKVTK